MRSLDTEGQQYERGPDMKDRKDQKEHPDRHVIFRVIHGDKDNTGKEGAMCEALLKEHVGYIKRRKAV